MISEFVYDLRMSIQLLRRVGVLALGIAIWTPVWSSVSAQAPTPTPLKAYFPPKGQWLTREPGVVGMDKAKLDEAIAYSIANQNTRTKDLSVDIPNTFPDEAP